jgi:hypothetical protein
MPSRPSQRPPSGENPPTEQSPSLDEDDDALSDDRPPLERILPDLIRRGLEAGRGPLGRVSESFFPRDIAASVVSQLGDIRSGVVKAVAQEVGRFLREADIASEVRKVLTGLDVEAQVRLRFKARDDGTLKPSLDIKLGEDKTDKTDKTAPEPRRSTVPQPPSDPEKR